MSAEAAEPPRSRTFRDASPREIRAALIPEERADFDVTWRAAMAEAAVSLDLTGVFDTLEGWRLNAATTEYLGHADYRRMLAQAEETLRTGQPPPGTVPLDEVKAYIEERLGR